jgi:biotin carboxyl carrier protein
MTRTRTIRAEMAGTIIAIERAVGDMVDADEPVMVMESMKMEIGVLAPAAGRVARIAVDEGDTVAEDDVLAVIEY